MKTGRWRERASTDGSSLELCHNVPRVPPTTTTSPPPPSTPLPPSPALAASALTKGLHPAFKMHNTSRSYLPSRMYSAGVPGIVPPTTTLSSTPYSSSSSSSTSASSSTLATTITTTPRAEEKLAGSPAFESYRDGGGGSGGGVGSTLVPFRSSKVDPATAQTVAAAASFAYASRMQQEGFPYGLSGVPSMSTLPSYSYSSDLYNYVTNGFPRKSRVCTFCRKVFTRSTTRRYHEKRCPLVRAAGSLMKGNSDSSMPPPPPTNGPSLELTESPDRPGLELPTLITVDEDAPSPPLPSASSSGAEPPPSSSLATSLGLASSLVRPHALNSSSFYSIYGSHNLATTMPTSSAVAPASSGASLAPLAPSSAVSSAPLASCTVDQNRNSVLSAIKEEVEVQEGKASSVKDDVSRDSELLRDKLGSQREEAGERQPPLFSPLSAHSRTPSDEDRVSEEGEAVPFKLPLSVGLKSSADLMSMSPFLRQYYQLAALQTVQGLAATAETPSLPVPFANNVPSAADKAPAGASSSDAQDVADDKEDEDSNWQDDEDTDHYSYSNPNTDIQEPFDVGDEKKKCNVCSKEFTQDKDLAVHGHVHQKYTPRSCRFCGEVFASQSDRVNHQRCHSTESLGCVVCGLQMRTKYALRLHVHHKHSSLAAEDTTCRFCHLAIESVHDLRRHFLSHRHHLSSSEQLSLRYLPSPLPVDLDSPVEEEASQDIPPPSIDSKTSQDSPEDLGSEPPPLLGPVNPALVAPVGKGSPVKMNGGNETGHSREKEWCRICQKEYPKSYMRYHEKEHADQKPYECSICKKRFGYKNNMKSHLKLHQGVKPYQCIICLARFTRGSTLRRHARRHGYTNDTDWELFVKKSGGRVRDRAREMMLAQDASLMAHKANPGPPAVAGARAMKADPSLLASLGKVEGVAAGKSYDVPAYPPTSAVPPNLFEAYHLPQSVTQAMFQSYMTPQQYLGFTTFPSSVSPALQSPQKDALDFSMPEKKRQRHNSSSSATTPGSQGTAQGSNFPTSSTLRLSSSGPACPALSTAAEGGRPQSAVDPSRAPDKREEGTRGNVPQLSHQYHPKHRASLCETVERLMEHRTSKEAASHSLSLGPDATSRSRAPDFPARAAAAHPLFQEAVVKRDAALHALSQDARQRDVPSRPVFRDVVTKGTETPQTDSQDFSNQVTLCCTQPPPPSSSPDQHGRAGSSPARGLLEPLQQESLASLLKSRRLFRCGHCDCYFTDYAMYYVHGKLHQPDRPFVCWLCQWDCQDRTTFASHMHTHLR